VIEVALRNALALVLHNGQQVADFVAIFAATQSSRFCQLRVAHRDDDISVCLTKLKRVLHQVEENLTVDCPVGGQVQRNVARFLQDDPQSPLLRLRKVRLDEVGKHLGDRLFQGLLFEHQLLQPVLHAGHLR